MQSLKTLTNLFKFSFLHVELIQLLLTIIQLFQQVLIQILQLIIFLLLVVRLQQQHQPKNKMILLNKTPSGLQCATCKVSFLEQF